MTLFRSNRLTIMFAGTLLALSACSTDTNQNQVSEATLKPYPETRQDPVIDTYFGTLIEDPYRWLEDDRSAATEAWVKAQNNVTYDYLEQLPHRDRLRDRLTRLLDYERESAPFEEGEYTYFYRNDGLQNQSVVYRIKQGETQETVFLDPNTFSADGTVSMSSLSFSEDGSL
ncbi:MAG: hypothetical protein RLZZ602_1479, partial [Pseudomonadota bacterium]